MSPPYECPRLLSPLEGWLSPIGNFQELEPDIHPVAALILCSSLGLGLCPAWFWNPLCR